MTGFAFRESLGSSVVRRITRAIDKTCRILTSPVRLLPHFVIIGAQRCGTSSLYNYLTKHPLVFAAFKKEVHFFDLNLGKGLLWYRAHFPTKFSRACVRQIHEQGLITGEASPYYIFHPLVPGRIADVIPDVKLIALLRNPVDRAYSHYHHEVREGYETLTFEQAIESESERLCGEREKLARGNGYHSLSHRHHSYVSRGIYVEQIEAWIRLFSEKQMLILGSEDFYDDPQTTLRRVFGFLELPTWDLREYREYQQFSYPKMDPAVKERLTSYFAPHNQRLYRYLGMDFGWD